MFMFTKSQKIAIVAWAWLMVVLYILILFQILYLEYFLVLGIVGILIFTELYGPYKSKPDWKSRLNIALIIGMILFLAVVLNKAIFWYSLIT